MNKNFKIVLQIALASIILFLGYKVYNSPMDLVRFERINETRRAAVISNLKDIREIQKYYKQNNGSYAGDFAALLAFAEEGQIPIVEIIADTTDIDNPRSIRDTIGFVSVRDSLFGQRENFNLHDIAIVPYSNNVQFELQAGTVDRSGMKLHVFEAKTLNINFLTKGMEKYRQEVINLNNTLEQLDKYPGLKVGSLTEISTDGNWE